MIMLLKRLFPYDMNANSFRRTLKGRPNRPIHRPSKGSLLSTLHDFSLFN